MLGEVGDDGGEEARMQKPSGAFGAVGRGEGGGGGEVLFYFFVDLSEEKEFERI